LEISLVSFNGYPRFNINIFFNIFNNFWKIPILDWHGWSFYVHVWLHIFNSIILCIFVYCMLIFYRINPSIHLYGSGLIYVVCVCLRMVVSNTYYVVFLFFFILCTPCVASGLSFCFSSSCVPPMLPLSLDCHFVKDRIGIVSWSLKLHRESNFESGTEYSFVLMWCALGGFWKYRRPFIVNWLKFCSK
jgi:hypothetical protein